MSASHNENQESKNIVRTVPSLLYFSPTLPKDSLLLGGIDPYAARIVVHAGKLGKNEKDSGEEKNLNNMIEEKYNSLVDAYVEKSKKLKVIIKEEETKRRNQIVKEVFAGDEKAYEAQGAGIPLVDKEKSELQSKIFTALIKQQNARTAPITKEIEEIQEKMRKAYKTLLLDHDIQFMKLQEELDNLKKREPVEEVSKELESILIHQLTEAALAFNVSPETLSKIEIVAVGSLAKQIATPFSDIDAFIIMPDDLPEEERRKLLEAGRAMYAISVNLDDQDIHQFTIDPVGYSPGKMSGSKQEILQIILDKSDSTVLAAFFQGRVIFGENSNYLEAVAELKQSLLEKKQTQTIEAADSLEEEKNNVENIKNDLIKPLSNALLLLRELEYPDLKDDKFVILDNLIPALVKKSVITPEDGKELSAIKNQLIKKRIDMHRMADGEQDSLSAYTGPQPTPKQLQKWQAACQKIVKIAEEREKILAPYIAEGIPKEKQLFLPLIRRLLDYQRDNPDSKAILNPIIGTVQSYIQGEVDKAMINSTLLSGINHAKFISGHKVAKKSFFSRKGNPESSLADFLIDFSKNAAAALEPRAKEKEFRNRKNA